MNRLLAMAAMLVTSFGLAAGCGSTVVTDDDDGDGECCLAEPICPDGAAEVDQCPNGSKCFEVEACCSTILCTQDSTCTIAPACDLVEEQVDTCEGLDNCRSVTACGVTIFCKAESFCGEVPTCDPGDAEVTECLEDVGCYVVEACNQQVLCSDTMLPQHGCPDQPPFDGEPCGAEGSYCDYATGDDCFDSYQCGFEGKGLVWTWVGGGCGVDG